MKVPEIHDSFFVARDRLIERLDTGVFGGVTLVSAPAGYGKTTVVAAWLPHTGIPASWYSLDEDDNDPARFFGHLLAALETAHPDVGREYHNVANAFVSIDLSSLMRSLVDEIIAIEVQFILVIDDLHLISDPAIISALSILVNNLPPHMRLVLLTREEPRFPISRLRVRGLLSEIGVEHLSFTRDEAAAFMNRSMGLDMGTDAVAKLHAKTEGWAAALQIAALSLVDRPDIDQFVASFQGTHRLVIDYLAEEVLSRQPPAIRDVLLKTSILPQLTGPLCEALTGRADGQEMLEELYRRHMLIFPLDDGREWFRYHALFADALQASARRDPTIDLPSLHARASRWFERNGYNTYAITHGFASGNVDVAADILERSWPELFYGIQPMTWLGWADRLPATVIRERPVLRAAYAWLLLDAGDTHRAADHITAVEALLKSVSPSEIPSHATIANTEEYRVLPGSTNAARGYLALITGDPTNAITYAQRALTVLPGDRHFWRGTAALFVGLARWTIGELEAAHRSILESVLEQRAAGIRFYEVFGMTIGAEVRLDQGRLRDARREYQRILDSESFEDQDLVALHVGLGELNRRWGNVNRAEEHVRRGFEIRDRTVLPATTYKLFSTRARIRESRRDYEGALADLDASEEARIPGAVPDPYPIDALRARVWLRDGRHNAARAWAEGYRDKPPTRIAYPDLFTWITVCRIGILTERDATLRYRTILNGIARGKTAAHGSPLVIEAEILSAIAAAKRGASKSALSAMEHAIDLAKPEGFLQVFVDDWELVEPILTNLITKGSINTPFATTLVETVRGAEEDPALFDANQLLVEPLSKREREVLTLIDQGLTNQGIADALYIALSTVKKHINNLFGKLTVRNRTEALRRARDLRLI